MTTLTANMRRVQVVALAGLTAVAVSCLCAAEVSRRSASEHDQLGQWARLCAAQVAAWTDGERTGTPTDPIERLRAGDHRFLEQFEYLGMALMRATDAAAVALTDAQGAVLCIWPPDATMGAIIDLPADRHRVVVRTADAAADSALTFALAPVGRGPALLPRAYVVVSTASASGPAWAGLSAPAAIAIVLTAMVAIGWWALWTLNRKVIRPLADLGGRGAGRGLDRLPVDRNDELGAIARQIEALREEAAGSRRQARRLQQSIDETVTRKTRQMSQLLQQAKRAADLDALTGLCNRRYLEEHLERIYGEQVERGGNLAIAMFDVDQFKPLNDQAGHAAGDALLRFLGELLRCTLRESDVGLRYGGDEFAVIFVDITGPQAREATQRVVRLFAQRMAVAQLPVAVTLSAGVAALDEIPAGSGAELMALADQALYRSKHSGKNQVTSASA